MASMDVDMSLDEMIASKPQNGRRRGGGGGGRGRSNGGGGGEGGAPSTARARYSQGSVPSTPAVASRQAQAAVRIQQQPRSVSAPQADSAFEAVKIIVSNLPLDVDDNAVKDLFTSTVGHTRECFLAYDKNGKHKGVATVVFQRKGDAQKAFNTYNNRLIDGR